MALDAARNVTAMEANNTNDARGPRRYGARLATAVVRLRGRGSAGATTLTGSGAITSTILAGNTGGASSFGQQMIITGGNGR